MAFHPTMAEANIKRQEIELERARATYAQDEKRASWRLNPFDWTTTESVAERKDRYESARKAYIEAVAEAYGTGKALDVESAERSKLFLARTYWLERWGAMGLGIAGGAYALGAVAFGISFGSALGFNFFMERYGAVVGWKPDSVKMERLKKQIEEKWVLAKQHDPTLTYEKFLLSEGSLYKKFSKARWWWGASKWALRTSIFTATLSATGARADLLASASQTIDSVAEGYGDPLTYGARLPQKASVFMLSQVAPVFGDVLGALVPEARASEYGGPRSASPLPIIEDGVSYETMYRTERILIAYIQWAEFVRYEYQVTMDMHDPSCKAEYARIQQSIQELHKMLLDLQKNAKDLNRFADTRARMGSGIDTARMDKITSSIASNRHLFSQFETFANVLHGAQDKLLSIPPRGYAWISGAVQSIDQYFDSRFKHKGYHKLTRHAARALIELYRDAYRFGLLQNDSLVVTEGFDPERKNGLTHPHESREHKDGSAWDARSGGKNFTKEYIATMFKMAALNPLYDIRYEPAGLSTKGLIEYVVNDLKKTFPKATDAQLRSWVSQRIGNATNTNAPHFHFTAEAPDSGRFDRMARGPQVSNIQYAGDE